MSEKPKHRGHTNVNGYDAVDLVASSPKGHKARSAAAKVTIEKVVQENHCLTPQGSRRSLSTSTTDLLP